MSGAIRPEKAEEEGLEGLDNVVYIRIYD